MDALERLKDNIRQVEGRIARACERSGRSPEDVNVIAVTKYVSLHTAKLALEAGLRHIGENRWQDAKEKWETLGDQGTWHFIGSLQTNKVKDVVGRFQYIHSLDRLPLANEIQKRAVLRDKQVNCFIQVNVSGETSKHGLPPDSLFHFAEQVREMSHIRVCGLMTMAPYEASPEAIRSVFRTLRELRDRLNDRNVFDYEIKELSMGMSADFEIAVEEGATWVRLGTVLLGRELDQMK